MKLRLSLLTGLFLSLTSAFAQDTNFCILLRFGQSDMESGGCMDDQDRMTDKPSQVTAAADSAKRDWKRGNNLTFITSSNHSLHPTSH